MFLLKCPKCNHDMKYQNASASLISKKKKCVYCGKTFSVRKYIVKKL